MLKGSSNQHNVVYVQELWKLKRVHGRMGITQDKNVSDINESTAVMPFFRVMQPNTALRKYLP